jgi:hypothetical protein
VQPEPAIVRAVRVVLAEDGALLREGLAGLRQVVDGGYEAGRGSRHIGQNGGPPGR